MDQFIILQHSVVGMREIFAGIPEVNRDRLQSASAPLCRNRDSYGELTTMREDETINLLADWRQGDERAADKLFERYVSRLIALVHSRLSTKLRNRVDPEDVVQSVYRVFFCGASQQEFVLERSGDLWRLLAAITIKKLLSKVEFHKAQKRSYTNDVYLADDASQFFVPVEVVSHEPGPDESATMMEEVQAVLEALDPLQRQIMELRLQGHGVEEIATEINRSQRTVRRTLEQARKMMEERLLGS
jgi:RNA polymerase sigma-70 factor (ECF subfamily)